jgi:DNA-binding NarL/FixJ family response regulator
MNKDPDLSVNSESDPVLQSINTALKRLGSRLEYLKAPDYFPEYEFLKDKKIIMIDDVFMILENILPDLVVASGRNAEAIHYKDQKLEDLIMELLDKNPDILILDYHLSDNVKGVEIARGLIRLGFKGKIVGGSSESERGAEFIKAGAVGNIDKSAWPVSDMVKELVKVVG